MGQKSFARASVTIWHPNAVQRSALMQQGSSLIATDQIDVLAFPAAMQTCLRFQNVVWPQALYIV